MRVSFFIQGKKSRTKIYARVRDGRSVDAKAPTEHSVYITEWSTKKGGLKHTKDANLKLLEDKISQTRRNIESAYNRDVGKKPICTNWLKNVLQPTKEIKTHENIVEYIKHYVENSSQLSKSTKELLRKTKGILEKIELALKRKINISEIDKTFMDEYYREAIKMNYSHNYLSRVWKCIKQMCSEAELNGVYVNPILRKCTLKEKTVPSVYLTDDELKRIEKLTIDDNALDSARDWLLIACHTGQRVSDFLNFNSKNITQKKVDGHIHFFLEITQVKTKNHIKIPLDAIVLKILEKWVGQFPPKVHPNTLNERFKKVARMAKLNETIEGGIRDNSQRKINGHYEKYKLVSTHIGRRSFATNNYGGEMSTPIIMAITGHKTEREFLRYIGKSQSDLAEQAASILLKKYDNR